MDREQNGSTLLAGVKISDVKFSDTFSFILGQILEKNFGHVVETYLT